MCDYIEYEMLEEDLARLKQKEKKTQQEEFEERLLEEIATIRISHTKTCHKKFE
ncbi:MAG: hypothetical protein HZA84_01080 [Thaumarchaeota archaeon]|nr:hypothetical protein [Nitrososphaerota archaeon]